VDCQQRAALDKAPANAPGATSPGKKWRAANERNQPVRLRGTAGRPLQTRPTGRVYRLKILSRLG